MSKFNGLGMNLGNLSRLSAAESRSISAENFTGAKGAGGMAEVSGNIGAAKNLGRGWKVSPCVTIKAGETFQLADINGQGAIQSIWMTGNIGRHLILRIYWDDQTQPSVEVPLADFFASPWTDEDQGINRIGKSCLPIDSVPVAVNPVCGFNCFWEMPFQKRAHMTIENRAPQDKTLFFQINYTLTEVPEDCGYFHAQFRRVNPVAYKEVFTILDNISGRGQFVGCSLGWGVNSNRWWGEGEIKFFIDGDNEFPTICGTGTEDYFGGSYNWEVSGDYMAYTTAYLGMRPVPQLDMYHAQKRFQMYRWHIMDPIRFQTDLKVTIQALGWKQGFSEYLPLQDDICSTACWYQTLPSSQFPELPDNDYLMIN